MDWAYLSNLHSLRSTFWDLNYIYKNLFTEVSRLVFYWITRGLNLGGSSLKFCLLQQSNAQGILSQQRIIWPLMSVLLRLRNPDLGIYFCSWRNYFQFIFLIKGRFTTCNASKKHMLVGFCSWFRTLISQDLLVTKILWTFCHVMVHLSLCIYLASFTSINALTLYYFVLWHKWYFHFKISREGRNISIYVFGKIIRMSFHV